MGGIASALGGLAAKGLEGVGRKIAGKIGGGAKGTATPKTKTEDGGKQQQERPQAMLSPTPTPMKSMKKGGPIKKTGVYRLHAGEYVVPAKGRSGKKASGKKRTTTKA